MKDADELLKEGGDLGSAWELAEKVGEKDGFDILEEIAVRVEGIKLQDDRRARTKALNEPLISLYRDSVSWKKVVLSATSDPTSIESLMLRIESAGSAKLADGLRKRIKSAQNEAVSATLRLVGQDEEPVEIREAIGWKDYPINVFIPPKWSITKDEIKKINRTETKIEAIYLGRPILPTRRLVDVDTGDWSIEICWRVGNRWKKEVIPRSRAMDSRGLLSLADRGCPISSFNSKLVVELLTILDQQESMPIDYSTIRLGWVGEKTKYFMLGNTVFQAPRAPKYSVELFTESAGSKQIAGAIKSEGTWERWLEALELVNDYPAPWAAVYAACAAPLLKILGAPNFGIDFAGPSGSGKSTTLELAASTYGKPKKGFGYRGWGGTLAGTEGLVGTLCDMPLLLDEGQLVPPQKRQEAGALLHSIIDGAGRPKGSLGRLGLGQVESWQTVLLSSSEDGITTWAEHDGVQARVVTLSGRPLGVGQAERAEKIKDLIEDNYGHLFPRLIKILAAAPEEVREQWRDWYHARIRELADTPDLAPMARRAARYMAAIDSAAHLIHHYLDVPQPAVDVSSWLWGRIQESCGGGDRAKRAIDFIWSWIWSHREEIENAPDSPGGRPGFSGWAGYWYDERGYVAIYPEAMERILKLANITSPKPILRDWVERGWLLGENGRTKIRIRPQNQQIAMMAGRPQVSVYALPIREC